MISGDDTKLREAGFCGFKSICALRRSKLAEVPEEHGIYLILRPDRCPPHFLYMKDSIRTSDLEELQAQWVEGSRILYIGKAGGSDIAEKLRDRLKRYFRYGEGHRGSGHAGGKRIWELTNSAELIACWKTTPSDEPRMVESELQEAFHERFGKYPFANDRG